MKYFYGCLLILSVSVALNADVRSLTRCGGGSGGGSFGQFPELQMTNNIVKTEGLIKDFVYMERRGKIIYRNEFNEVWATQSGQPFHDIINVMYHPISRVLGPNENMILAKQDHWMLSTLDKQWYQMYAAGPIQEHLYWSGDRVFSMAPFDPASKKVYFYKHTSSGTGAYYCNLPNYEGEEWNVGQGHTYPFAFLYTTKNSEKGPVLRTYRLTLEKTKGLLQPKACQVDSITTYSDPMPGNVKTVHHIGNLGTAATSGYAISLKGTEEYPNQRLFWDYPNQCSYFKMDAEEFFVPNHSQPVLMTVEKEGGIGIFYPNLQKAKIFLKDEVKSPIKADDLWLTNDAKHLFVSVKPENYSNKILFHTRLDKQE